MTKESDKILNGLWEMQYKPLEKKMLELFEGDERAEAKKTIARYKKMTRRQKIRVLDQFASMLGL